MKVKFLTDAATTDVAIIVAAFEGKKLTAAAQFLDETAHGLLTKAIESNRFKGKIGEALTLIAPNDLKVRRIILTGFGAEADLTTAKLEDIGGHIYAALANTPDKEAVLHLGDYKHKKFEKGTVAAHIAFGALLRSWRFDKYLTQEKAEDKPQLKAFSVITQDTTEAQKLFKRFEALSEGVFLCRSLGAEPPNILHPESYPTRIKEELTPLGVKVEALGEKKMKKLGMGSLLGVGQGSDKESHLVVMQWMGGAKDQKPIAFVGKGVTFDTGGISIKPANGMEDMKYDMAGSAAVVGLIKALALRKAKVNVVGVVGLVENMPSGTAQRPGDIVTTMSGQTVAVLNTDAEGRLVLADALWYTQDRFKPQFMVNLATLTGAIAVALGQYHAGLFSNNDVLATKLFNAGQESGELLWRLPMSEDYNQMLKSPVADMQNITNGRYAGSITAAQFLERFVNKVPWAHLDIAVMADITTYQVPTAAKGPTGFGVRLLERLVHDHYESHG
jgi:leucyl aminopeptidase